VQISVQYTVKHFITKKLKKVFDKVHNTILNILKLLLFFI